MSEGPHTEVAGAMPAWTPERMLERLGGDEALARELAAIFVEESPRMMAAVREGAASGSADALRQAAHALKGSMSNFLDGGPVAIALELEMIGREGRMADAPTALARLEQAMPPLVERLRAFHAG